MGAGAIGKQGGTNKIEQRTGLQAAGLGDSKQWLDNQTAMVGLGSMRSATPEDGLAQGSYGSVVRGFDTQRRRQLPRAASKTSRSRHESAVLELSPRRPWVSPNRR